MKFYKSMLALTGLATVASAALVAPVNAAPTPAPAVCAPQPGIDAKTIKMAVQMPRTGPSSPLYTGFDSGVQLRLDQENAKGGILGRKVVTSAYDDQSSGLVQAGVGAKAVADGNFGIIVASAGDTMYPALKAQGVPAIGPGITAPFGTDRNAIGSAGAPAFTVSTTAQLQKLKDLGATKVAVLSGNNAASLPGATAAFRGLPLVGLQQGLLITDIPATGFDATSVALRLKNAGVDAVSLSLTPDPGMSVLQALKLQNVPMKAIVLTSASDPAFVKQAGSIVEGVSASTLVTPLTVNKPAIRTFVNAMKARGVNPYNVFAGSGYVAADLFVKGMKLAGKCPTREGFINATRGITKFDGAGLLPAPISFAPGLTPNGDPAKCTWYTIVKNGTPVADAGPTCGKFFTSATGQFI